VGFCCFDELLIMLSAEYNCLKEDFMLDRNIVTVSALNKGRRAYSKDKYFFHMVTLGKNAVITADESLHPFLRDFASGREGYWLFEIPNLLPLEGELVKYGYSLSQTYHMFMPRSLDMLEEKLPAFEVCWYVGEEINGFYGDERFPNAILSSFNPARPDTLAVCAFDGRNIMGMAGCSEDAPGWFQIGIYVLPGYRSAGVAVTLVTLLRNRIIREGGIPFYGTSVSNYHSWNVALNSGFVPAWLEIGTSK